MLYSRTPEESESEKLQKAGGDVGAYKTIQICQLELVEVRLLPSHGDGETGVLSLCTGWDSQMRLPVRASGRHTILCPTVCVCVQRMVPKYLQPTEEMVSGEMSRVKKPFKGIFISEKVGLHPRLPLPRREPV